MAKQIEIIPAAAEESRDAIRWYAAQDERAARGFEVEFANALKTVSEQSGSFASYRKGTKRCMNRGINLNNIRRGGITLGV